MHDNHMQKSHFWEVGPSTVALKNAAAVRTITGCQIILCHPMKWEHKSHIYRLHEFQSHPKTCTVNYKINYETHCSSRTQRAQPQYLGSPGDISSWTGAKTTHDSNFIWRQVTVSIRRVISAASVVHASPHLYLYLCPSSLLWSDSTSRLALCFVVLLTLYKTQQAQTMSS